MALLAFHNCENGKLVTSDYLAKSIRTNPTVVRRLVARLVDAELVKAYKGKSGGIELAKCPDKISLGDIYSATVEKTLLASPDKSPVRKCAVSCSMVEMMKSIIGGVEESSIKYLSGITLADLRGKIARDVEVGQ